MPTYDGIGETITHKLEIEGDLFLQDIEGGSLSTQVPLEIFSDFGSSGDNAINSRMLRLRVQNYGETDVSNSYVTDFGIRGEADKDYFFITAPQNTSNVGDQNTFVISKTSNVGIGTTDPGTYRLLVNNSSTKQFGVPGDDTPTTGDTLIYTEAGEWVYAFPAGNLPAGSINNEILTWNGTNWVPNSSIITTNSNTAIGIGTYSPSSNLHVIGSVTATSDVNISGVYQGGKLRVGTALNPVPANPNVTVPGDLTVSGTLTSDEWIHTSNLDITGNINVDYDVLIDGTYQGTGMRLDGTLQNLRGAIPDLGIPGSITATGDIKTDQTFRGADASLTGTLTTSNITHGTEITLTSNLLMGPDKTLTTSNIVGGSPLTISTASNVQILNSNVGIGITDPTEKLHVDGNILASGTANCAYDTDTTHYFGRAAIGYSGISDRAEFAHVDHNNTTGYALRQNNVGDVSINTPTGRGIYFKENDTNQMILSDSNVGIGTDNPTANLHIAATVDPTILIEDTGVANQARITFRTTTTNWTVGQHGANGIGDFKISNSSEFGGNDVVIIRKTSGNVGVGIVVPTEKLHVDGNILATGNITQTTPVIVKYSLQNQSAVNNAAFTLRDLFNTGQGAVEIINNGGFTTSNRTLTVPSSGYYRVTGNFVFTNPSDERVSIAVQPNVGGDDSGEIFVSDYIRNYSGHNTSSTLVSSVYEFTVNLGLKFSFAQYGIADSGGANVTSIVGSASFVIVEKL
jgi:hypothetical protein